MRRFSLRERADWREKARSVGFGFHEMYGEPYWVDDAAYAFSMEEIEERIEAPTEALHELCMALVADVVDDEAALRRLAIPDAHIELVRQSWHNGDRHLYVATEVAQCTQRTFGVLERRGLRIQPQADAMQVTTPADFNRMFPATGGALYGRSSHGWTASFQRPGARTRIPRLYLAGGSTHPGPGVPMAALSGRSAAASLLADLTSQGSFRRTAMRGGTSMR